MQSMHTPGGVRSPIDKSAGRVMAQLVQRGFAVENRAMQALQTGAEGQLRHTAHWLGNRLVRLERLEKGFCNRRLNTRSIYSGSKP